MIFNVLSSTKHFMILWYAKQATSLQCRLGGSVLLSCHELPWDTSHWSMKHYAHHALYLWILSLSFLLCCLLFPRKNSISSSAKDLGKIILIKPIECLDLHRKTLILGSFSGSFFKAKSLDSKHNMFSLYKVFIFPSMILLSFFLFLGIVLFLEIVYLQKCLINEKENKQENGIFPKRIQLTGPKPVK